MAYQVSGGCYQSQITISGVIHSVFSMAYQVSGECYQCQVTICGVIHSAAVWLTRYQVSVISAR